MMRTRVVALEGEGRSIHHSTIDRHRPLTQRVRRYIKTYALAERSAPKRNEDGGDLDRIIDQAAIEVFGGGAPESSLAKEAWSLSPSTTARSPSLQVEDHSASPTPISSSSRAFTSSTFPDPYAGQRPIPGVISYHPSEEYKRFIDSFKGE